MKYKYFTCSVGLVFLIIVYLIMNNVVFSNQNDLLIMKMTTILPTVSSTVHVITPTATLTEPTVAVTATPFVYDTKSICVDDENVRYIDGDFFNHYKFVERLSDRYRGNIYGSTSMINDLDTKISPLKNVNECDSVYTTEMEGYENHASKVEFEFEEPIINSGNSYLWIAINSANSFKSDVKYKAKVGNVVIFDENGICGKINNINLGVNISDWRLDPLKVQYRESNDVYILYEGRSLHESSLAYIYALRMRLDDPCNIRRILIEDVIYGNPGLDIIMIEVHYPR